MLSKINETKFIWRPGVRPVRTPIKHPRIIAIKISISISCFKTTKLKYYSIKDNKKEEYFDD